MGLLYCIQKLEDFTGFSMTGNIILSGPIIMVLGMLTVWYQSEVEQIFCEQFRKSSELESLNYVQIIPNTGPQFGYNFQIDCQCRLQNPF